MGLSINKKVWQYMAVVTALLFIVIAFLFYIKPVFIALVLGVLVTVSLSKIVDMFSKATQKYSAKERKVIAVISSVSVILIAVLLLFSGAVHLVNNVSTVIETLEDFTGQYNETAEDMAENLTNISFNETFLDREFQENGINNSGSGSDTGAGPPPTPANDSQNNTTNTSDASNSSVPLLFSFDLSATNLIQSVLTAGSGLMSSTTETLSFIGSTIFAACLIIPIMAGYYFKDRGNIRSKFIAMVPEKYKETVGFAMQNIVNDMGAFTIMKVIEIVIITFLYCAGFYVIGLPHWLLAGVLIGLFNFVPYVGFALPAIPVTVYAYTLGTEIMFSAIGIITVIQLFDYFFILPNMVMKTVKVSSFTAVILTLAGLKLAGVFGLIFAVPIYIFCKIILKSCYKMLVKMYPDPSDPAEIILDEG
ncbi:hypothetical protein MmiAt1_14270 [Methanimicrococcus sp. At1]|uniref:AI-2E family transporter n=1 Tax=Methanimicrococcus hacksteinii TaxID=3028293 RepID=A0ABU3VQY7_9EURY|nr:AI-2E family transporter [Methanimicrococcus sp. At1]MDV0445828.1 hypothetical protein [Methanimicrococcus sp. At1]